MPMATLRQLASRLGRGSLLRPGLATQIVGLAVLSVSLTIAYFALVSYRLEYDAEEERFGLALDRIAATAALSVSGDDHRQIRSNADAAKPEFQRIRAYLERVRAANYLKYDQIYTFNVDAPDQLRFAVMLQEQTFVGDRYDMVAANIPVLMQVWRQRQAAHTKLYRDANGEFLSAYAPIFDSHGQLAGVLEVDYAATEFMRAVGKKARRLVLISLIGLVLAALVSNHLAVSLRQALRAIRDGVEAVGQGNFSYRISLARRDELGLMASQVNRMAETLSERFHMLKFLPRHTLEAITRRAQLGQTVQCERVSGAVLFSDIRGYTALSAQMTDEAIVGMLNQYLRRQAEIVEQHGGSVDKFMGDAVLALFIGQGGARRAVQAGLQIRAAVEQLNRAALAEGAVHIGIGISVGELVLGEIGSEDRRERTPIGSVVNLASRLCSRAGSEEILVSESVRVELGAALQVSSSQPLLLKGFADPQLGHSVFALAADGSG
jgi:adenylate cyclase